VTPVPLALWATFLAVVVYLRFPDTPVNGTEPGNLLIVLGVLPAVSLVVLPTAFPSIDPLSLSVGGIVVSLTAVGVGWVSVRRWLDVRPRRRGRRPERGRRATRRGTGPVSGCRRRRGDPPAARDVPEPVPRGDGAAGTGGRRLLAGCRVGVQQARAVDEARRSEAAVARALAAETERERLLQLNHLLRHDILGSINVIQGYTDLALEDAGADQQPHLRTVHRHADSVAELIQNVRTYIASVEGEEPDLRACSLSGLLSREAATLRSAAAACTLTVDVEPGLSVTADDLLGSVFSNLLRNAVLHNREPDPEVTLTAWREGPTAKVRVADNGPGIPDHVQRRLFEPSETGDHGFGLYLVKTLVDRYGGSVAVEDTGSTGTAVVVSLQLSGPATPATTAGRAETYASDEAVG
jgi:signal transduction histidine kinase